MTDAFYLTQKTAEQYIKMAEGYDGHDLIEKLKKFLPDNSLVLELGSGPGTDLKILSETNTVTGSDFLSIFSELYCQ